MFEGCYEHKLDEKDRLIVPGRFRSELGRRFYVTRGHEECLYILREADYMALAEIVRAVAAAPAGREADAQLVPTPSAQPGGVSNEALLTARAMFSPSARALQRHFFSDSYEASPDAQGRIILADSLKRYAGIDRTVVVVGVGDRIELWSPELWQAEMTGSREKAQMAARDLSLA